MYRFVSVLNTLFWAIFGIGDPTVFTINGYPTDIMQIIALVLFAVYEWLMIIILINILIAMMSESYEMISVCCLNYLLYLCVVT